MKKFVMLLSAAVLLQGCAFQHGVQQIGVSYNNAVTDLSNELTLLNIVRAENRQPLHYMAFSRLSGSIVFTGTGGFNAAIHDPTRTMTTTNENDLAGVATTTKSIMSNASGTNASMSDETDITNPVSTAKNTIATALGSGGNIYTPSLQAQVATGPSFDMDLLDTQAFYQGILGQTPITTFEALQDQGFDPLLLDALMIDRIEFTALTDTTKGVDGKDIPKDKRTGFEFKKGALLQVLVNDPESDQGALFWSYICGAQLSSQAGAPKKLMTMDQVVRGQRAIALKDLASLDGKALDLDQDVQPGNNDFSKIEVIRPSDKRVAKVSWGACPAPLPIVSNGLPHKVVVLDPAVQALILKYFGANAFPDQPTSTGGAQKWPVPWRAYKDYTPEPTDQGDNANGKRGQIVAEAEIRFTDPATGDVIKTVNSAVSIVFRSPEGVVRYLGAYIRAQKVSTLPKVDPPIWPANAAYPPPISPAPPPYLVGDLPVFEVSDDRNAYPRLVSTEFNGTRYSIVGEIGFPENRMASRNMQVISIVEELIDLQKSGTDRPSTVPVQVLP